MGFVRFIAAGTADFYRVRWCLEDAFGDRDMRACCLVSPYDGEAEPAWQFTAFVGHHSGDSVEDLSSRLAETLTSPEGVRSVTELVYEECSAPEEVAEQAWYAERVPLLQHRD
ncbi:hypothetical protein BHE90_017366, partial [Fusarium euwallaceae]